MDSSLPVFIDLPEKSQAEEIRQYLMSAGSDLTGSSKENIYDELSCLLDACDNWLKSASDADLEAMMNSFISLILFCNYDEKLTRKFISKMTEIGASDSNALLRIKILNNLFIGLPETNNLRYDAYLGQLRLASKFGHTNAIITQLKQVKRWLDNWAVSIEQKRGCLRELHAALKDEQKGEEATRVILELLSTYDDESATSATQDAENCILDFIAKPDIYVMDHLLKLKPVGCLQGKPIYKLLEIFVSGVLADYHKFYESNKEYIEKSGLSHEQNLNKMRVLTLLTLATNQMELSFSTLQEQLQLEEENMEEFIINVVKSRLIHAKIDQINERVIIRSTSRRSFDKKEWEEVQQKLTTWLTHLQLFRSNLDQVIQVNS